MKELSHYKNALIQDLCQLISIPTVNAGDSADNMPFGVGIADGFAWVKEKALAFGFSVKEFDGYALQIDVGEGYDTIGMLCHVDVVPAGEDWNTEPFVATIQEDRIYGRGTVDDKGPLICCLYAAKYISDHNLLPQGKKIRIIVGGDEEISWRGINYYNSKAESPRISFAADGMFPLVFGEKGLIAFDLERDYAGVAPGKIQLMEMDGGTARNCVPSKASFRLKPEGNAKELYGELAQFAKANNIHLELTENTGILSGTIFGKNAHAMFPERGINAISQMMHILQVPGGSIDLHECISLFNKYIANDYTGKLFGAECKDKESGALTFNIGKIQLSNHKLRFEADIRYPVSKKFNDIYANVEALARNVGCDLRLVNHLAPIYFKRDDDVVRKLEQAYRYVTGDQMSEPFTVGAATYARTMRNTVAFGPIFPGQEVLSHQSNEYISIDDLMTVTHIYIEALKNLCSGCATNL